MLHFFYTKAVILTLTCDMRAGLSDAALAAVTALGQCKLHLCDVRDGKLLAGALLFQLLSSYIQVRDFLIICPWSISYLTALAFSVMRCVGCEQVCMGAASVLSALGHSRDAAAWYGRAMQLADLVATEDHSLQLYTLLHRCVMCERN